MKTNLKSKLNNKKSLIAAVLLFVFTLSSDNVVIANY